MRELTRKQADVLAVIRAFVQVQGYPPTYPQLMEAMGFRAPHTVACYLEALERKGAVAVDRHRRRGIRLTAPGGLRVRTVEELRGGL